MWQSSQIQNVMTDAESDEMPQGRVKNVEMRSLFIPFIPDASGAMVTGGAVELNAFRGRGEDSIMCCRGGKAIVMAVTDDGSAVLLFVP